MKKLVIILIVVAVVSILAIPSVLFADPPGGKVNAFVCPILPQGQNHPNATELPNGDWTIFPGKAGDPANSPVSVPEGATNIGPPGNGNAVPGEEGYSPIWNKNLL